MNGKACSLAVILLGVVLAAGAGHSETLWCIGVPDGQYKELAIAGRHADYVARFPNDVVFRVPRSKPDQDWPYIQPGPGDAWAGGRAHPFRIEFRLNSKPHGAYRLNIFLVDTHSTSPPVLEINVNGRSKHTFQLPAGGGNGALTDPKAGRKHSIPVVFPADALNKGSNVITLTAIENSWLLYDAILLESGVPGDGPDVSTIEASSSPFFRSEDGELRQAIRVKVNNPGLEGDCELALSGARQESRKVHLVQGENAFTILVKPFERAEAVRVTMTTAARKKEADLEGRPERKWKIYVAPSAHTDIGYTDLQEKIFERHNSNTAAALKACETHPDFKWNLEVFAQADWYRKQGDEALKTLEQRIIEGRIGLTSLYLNMLTGLCSGEEMVKVLEPAQTFGRAHSVPVTVATLTDVPTAVGTLPMFLKQAGVKYFVEGINEDRGPVFKYADKRMIQSPFWWEGLDGSRVMAVFTRGYAQAGAIGLRDGVEMLEQRLPGWINALDRPDYPCDALYANGAFSDNESVTTRYIEVARDWNKAWEFPQIIVARADEFFQYVDQHFGQTLPVFHGDMGSYWEDGAASSANQTGMNRVAKARLNAAERWFALAAVHDPTCEFPRADFAKAWEDAIYYDEHTWGAAGSISDPKGVQTVKQWDYKASYARRASEKAQQLFQSSGQDAFNRLTQIKSAGSDGANYVTVQNTCSWPRDILVGVRCSGKDSFLEGPGHGGPVPALQVEEGLVFEAKHVPPLGYRRYKLGTRGGELKGTPLLREGADAYTWESPRFRYRIDPKTGAFASIEELGPHREWVDASSGYGVNQFLYVTGGNGTSLIHPGAKPAPPLQPVSHAKANVAAFANGSDLAILRIDREGANVPSVQTFCVIRADGRMELLNRVLKEETTEKEAGYFAFPFRLDAPDKCRTFFDLPYGIVEADKEQPPGADREWYAANTFASVSDDRIAAYVATREAPLFTVGNMVRGAWPGKVDNNRGTIFAYVFNNYWHTNYKASQGGKIPFTFSIKLSENGFDPVLATRFGAEAQCLAADDGKDTIDQVVRPGGSPRHAEESFFKMDDGPVMLAELTQGNDGRLLARLYNPSYEAASTLLEFPRLRIKNAWKTDLFGQHEEALRVSRNPVDVQVPARGIVTLALETQPK